jgi:hypothetical protein
MSLTTYLRFTNLDVQYSGTTTNQLWGCGDKPASNSFYVAYFAYSGTNSNPSTAILGSVPWAL